MTETAKPTAPANRTEVPADIAGLTFDKALDELRDVVARLEEGGLPLEESIVLYERGAALHEHCGKLLDSAELRVRRLVDGPRGGAPQVMDLRPEDDDEL